MHKNEEKKSFIIKKKSPIKHGLSFKTKHTQKKEDNAIEGK